MEAWDFAEPLSKRPKCPFLPFFATSSPGDGLEVVPPPGHTRISLSQDRRERRRGDEIASDRRLDDAKTVSFSLFHFDLFQRFGKEGAIRQKKGHYLDLSGGGKKIGAIPINIAVEEWREISRLEEAVKVNFYFRRLSVSFLSSFEFLRRPRPSTTAILLPLHHNLPFSLSLLQICRGSSSFFFLHSSRVDRWESLEKNTRFLFSRKKGE